MTPTAPDARQSCSSRPNDNGSHRHKTIGSRPCELVPHAEYLNSSNGSGIMRISYKEHNCMGNKPDRKTKLLIRLWCLVSVVLGIHILLWQSTWHCHVSVILDIHIPLWQSTWHCHAERQVKAAKNHPMPVMGPTRMHRNAQVGESVVTSLINDCYVYITQHKLVYRKILLNLRTLPPKRDPCYYVCNFKAISFLI